MSISEPAIVIHGPYRDKLVHIVGYDCLRRCFKILERPFMIDPHVVMVRREYVKHLIVKDPYIKFWRWFEVNQDPMPMNVKGFHCSFNKSKK